ncbi:hypothetical protein PM082_016737 [Marasmius tenuissimus]|nr:hypothetical protein PM082_016737 [Marasmius tenuissimus]
MLRRPHSTGNLFLHPANGSTAQLDKTDRFWFYSPEESQTLIERALRVTRHVRVRCFDAGAMGFNSFGTYGC